MTLDWKRVDLDSILERNSLLSLERNFKKKGGEALEKFAQQSCGYPTPGKVQGQAGWGSEQPGLVEGVSANGGGL